MTFNRKIWFNSSNVNKSQYRIVNLLYCTMQVCHIMFMTNMILLTANNLSLATNKMTDIVIRWSRYHLTLHRLHQHLYINLYICLYYLVFLFPRISHPPETAPILVYINIYKSLYSLFFLSGQISSSSG